MKDKRKVNWKEIATSILVGAFVAFFSSLFQGITDALQGHGNDILGGISATMTLLAKRTLS